MIEAPMETGKLLFFFWRAVVSSNGYRACRNPAFHSLARYSAPANGAQQRGARLSKACTVKCENSVLPVPGCGSRPRTEWRCYRCNPHCKQVPAVNTTTSEPVHLRYLVGSCSSERHRLTGLLSILVAWISSIPKNSQNTPNRPMHKETCAEQDTGTSGCIAASTVLRNNIAEHLARRLSYRSRVWARRLSKDQFDSIIRLFGIPFAIGVGVSIYGAF